MYHRNLYWVSWSCGDFSRMMNMLVDRIEEAPNATGDVELLRSQWASYSLNLMNRMAICNEAVTNLAKVHVAYTEAVPLHFFRVTLVRIKKELNFIYGVLHSLEGHFTYFNSTRESNHIHCTVWGEITYLFPIFNGVIAEVWEWITFSISSGLGAGTATSQYLNKWRPGRLTCRPIPGLNKWMLNTYQASN